MFDLVPFGKRREDSFSQLAKSLNDMFSDDFFAPMRSGALSFSTDIKEDDKSYTIEAELPGFRKEDIEIDYAQPYLSIKAVRKEQAEEKSNERRVVRRERRYGEYIRRFYVQDIEEESIRASLKDGVLFIEVQKRQKPTGRRIDITAEEG